MNVAVENDMFVLKQSAAKREDYIDLLAEMDILVAASACPGEAPNDGKPKPLGIEIYE